MPSPATLPTTFTEEKTITMSKSSHTDTDTLVTAANAAAPTSQSKSEADGSGDLYQVDEVKVVSWKVGDSTEATKPSAREGHCCCAVGDDIYIFGGVSISETNGVDEKSDLWKFSLKEQKWTLVMPSKGSEKPLSRSAATMSAVGSKLYLFGGLNQSVGWLDDMLVFDTETNCWREEDESTGNMPSARDKLSSAVIGQCIWFFGGFGPKVATRGPLDLEDDEDISSDDEIHQLERQQEAAQFGWFDDLHVYDTQTKVWAQPVQLSMGRPSPRCAASMISYRHLLVIFGGRDADGRLNDLHLFDTEKRKWLKDRQVTGSPPDCRSFHAATLAADSNMLVVGGRGTENQHYNDVYSLSLERNSWTKLETDGLSARACHTLVSLNNQLIVFGGSSAFNQTLQHCDTFYSDLLVASYSSQEDYGCSPPKLKKVR